MSDKTKIAGIQTILGVEVDGIAGPETQAAWDELMYGDSFHVEYETYASSFADPADIEAFEKCKAEGNTDEYCFDYGDNGIGCWGASTVEGSGPACALPPEYMEQKWGSVDAAKHKKVRVIRTDPVLNLKHQVVCTLKDRMPCVENCANEARIDLNPDAAAALKLEPPFIEPVVWFWVSEENEKGIV
jgi:hypothetical protein